MFDEKMFFETLLILALIALNGVFAMSEIAVVSSRRTRLQLRADKGSAGARRALKLLDEPTRFLSTVQVGITLVGVLAGAYGGARLAGELRVHLEQIEPIAAYSSELSLAIVVIGITYLSLVIGELVPKQIALNHPERIAAAIAAPMDRLSVLAAPIVKVLSVSTELVLRLFRIRKSQEPPVTEEEVAALIDVGTEAGIFEEEEHDLVERVFLLGDQRISSLMTPRHRIAWLDIRDPPEVHRRELIRRRYSHYLVCDGDLDHVVGMVHVMDLLADLLAGRPIELRRVMRRPLFVPESLHALRLLELFRESKVHLAVVIDEYGEVEGLVTLHDVVEEITGELVANAEPRIIRREDGSWLVDASIPVDEFWEHLGLDERRRVVRSEYNTLGGLVVSELGRIPRSGDTFEARDLKFEVVDMDGRRVDKVLVTPRPGAPREAPDAGRGNGR